MDTRTLNTVQQTGYAIHFIKDEIMGSGAFGNVYYVKLAMPSTHDMYPILSKYEWVYKIVPNERFNASEAKIAARYASSYPWLKHYQFSTIKTAAHTGWITECIKGKPFSRANTKDLDFKQLMQLVFELVVRANLFHHHTLKGNAVIHGDINHTNIHFNIYPDSNRMPDIEYLDYGLSIELKENDSPDVLICNTNIPKSMQVNKEYFPKETYEKMFGIKTDIYMLAECIYEVLANRFPPTKPDIARLIKGFLRRAIRRYQKRPDSDEFMKFFTLVNQFYKIPESDFYRKNRVAAKLAVLCLNKKNKKMSHENDLTWGQYYLHDVGDFTEYDNDINITVRCIAANKCKVNWSRIADNSDFIESISRLDKIEMVDNKIMNDLLAHPIICKKFARGSLSVLRDLFKVPVESMRKIAIAQIEHKINQVQSIDEVKKIVTELESMAMKNKINYLYARQGCSFSLNQHQWKNQDVSGTWLKIMNMAEQRKMQLAYAQITFEEFKNTYNENYQAEFFKNPWSKMRIMLNEYSLHAMHEVFEHVKKYPDSRTARVLKAIALAKIDSDVPQNLLNANFC